MKRLWCVLACAVLAPLFARGEETPPVAKTRSPRVIFLTQSGSSRCTEALARLKRPGGDFDKLRSVGWKIGSTEDCHLQIVGDTELPDLVEKLVIRDFPTVACIADGEILRSFKTGCTTPLDMWTFGWLAKGVDERPPGTVSEAALVETTGHYPLRGNHWSIDEDWNPSRATVLAHLRGPVHGPQVSASYQLESWAMEELRSLHDTLHEQLMGGVSGGRQAAASSNQFSASRKAGF